MEVFKQWELGNCSLQNWDISHGMTRKSRNIEVFFRVFPWQNRTSDFHDYPFQARQDIDK